MHETEALDTVAMELAGTISQLSPVSIRGMFRFVVQNDRIARRTDYWDSAEFARQTHR